jgi:hypothetical protein
MYQPRMRGYSAIIQEAELTAMPPESVADFLKRRANQTKAEARNDPVDEDTEKALRGRADPLIDLALARYGRHMAVVLGLFQSSAASSPIRLACLTNKSIGKEFLQSFPEGLLNPGSRCSKDKPGPICDWLSEASGAELSALFENPTLSDSFLTGLLERRGEWATIADDRLCGIIYVLSKNPRMRTPRESEIMDGWAESSYHSVFSAAWELAETAPVNENWAECLGWLYEQLLLHAHLKSPLKVAERWHIDPADSEELQEQERNHESGYLSNVEIVRKGLARLALSKNFKLVPELLASVDLAFRAAAYADGDLNPEQLRAGYEKDGEIFFNQAIRNLSLWRRRGTRQALDEIAWDIAKHDKDSDLMAPNVYNMMVKDMREKHPAWFADESKNDDDGAPDHLAVIKDDMAALASRLDRHTESAEAMEQTLIASMRRTDDADDRARAFKNDISALAQHLDRQAKILETVEQTLHSLVIRVENRNDQPPAAKNDILELASHLNHHSKSFGAVEQTLRSLMSQTKWIWWLLLGTLAASLRHL